MSNLNTLVALEIDPGPLIYFQRDLFLDYLLLALLFLKFAFLRASTDMKGVSPRQVQNKPQTGPEQAPENLRNCTSTDHEPQNFTELVYIFFVF